MKELFERHRDQLTPEEDQAIWGRVEQKLSHRGSFWQSWRFPVSLAATASAALVVFTLTRGSHELATVNVREVGAPAPLDNYVSPAPERQTRGTDIQAQPKEDKDGKVQGQGKQQVDLPSTSSAI